MLISAITKLKSELELSSAKINFKIVVKLIFNQDSGQMSLINNHCKIILIKQYIGLIILVRDCLIKHNNQLYSGLGAIVDYWGCGRRLPRIIYLLIFRSEGSSTTRTDNAYIYISTKFQSWSHCYISSNLVMY